MTKSIKSIILILTILSSVHISAQSNRLDKPELKKRILENSKLFQINVDKAYEELPFLLTQSRSLKDSVSELKILDRKCKYFYIKNKTDSLIVSSKILQNKAEQYGDLYSKAMGNIYLAEVYSLNQYYDKALKHLEIAYETLERDKSHNLKIFYAKANVLNSFANVYADKGEPEKAVAKLQQVIESYNELKNPQEINKFQYLNYSNIASLYVLYNMDSAKSYANKSIALKPTKAAEDKVMMMNYTVIGKALKKEKKYKEALDYFRKAIAISKNDGIEMNADNILSEIVDVFNKTGKKDSAIFYENKIKQLEINNLKSKYNSLKEVIDKDSKDVVEKENESFWIYLSILLIIVFFSLWWLFVKKRKNDANENQQAYNNLIEMLKNGDASFMFMFEKMHPDFSEKLLSVNPQLSKSEIEFCALLKLNLSTKEIAKISFIEPRTVQNKKYRIRKRLGISSDADIYNWFNTF